MPGLWDSKWAPKPPAQSGSDDSSTTEAGTPSLRSLSPAAQGNTSPPVTPSTTVHSAAAQSAPRGDPAFRSQRHERNIFSGIGASRWAPQRTATASKRTLPSRTSQPPATEATSSPGSAEQQECIPRFGQGPLNASSGMYASRWASPGAFQGFQLSASKTPSQPVLTAAQLMEALNLSDEEMNLNYEHVGRAAYAKVETWHDTTEPDICTICKELPGTTGGSVQALPCAHVFCKECILHWLRIKPSCPNCRNDV